MKPMTRKQKRISMIVGGLAGLGLAAGIMLYALEDTIVFFYTPAEVVEKYIKPGTRFRLGGLVEAGSVVRGESKTITFTVTDTDKSLPVSFTGVLPDLFREGQGVVAEGILGPNGKFIADTVLAKHDETYMPREVADALKKKGVWKYSDGKSE
jgi:cytochrome c-type biogenesis protein CcmE